MSKTRRPPSFVDQSVAKKARVEEKLALDILPADMWKEIFTYLNKKDLRHVGTTCPAFYPMTQDLFLDAPWPPIDYRRPRPDKTSKVRFLAPNGYFFAIKDRYLFTLQNGDVALALEDGRLIVLRLRDLKWHLFGRHERLQIDGSMRGFQIKDIIALNSSEIVSCAEDGIRIWDRMLASQKQHIILFHVGSWASRPQSLLRLSNYRFVSGCWDGSLYMWRREGNEYRHEKTLSLGDDQELHHLKKLQLINNEMVAEYSQFIARWNFKGELLARMELTDLKKQLIALLPNPKAINEKESSLTLDWSFPAGYVGVRLNWHFFIVNIAGNGTQPCYLSSFFDDIQFKVTHTGDIVVLESLPVPQGIRVLAGWNPVTNVFAVTRIIHFDQYVILNNGHLLRQDQSMIYLFDPYQNVESQISLRLPRNVKFFRIEKQLQNGDLLVTSGSCIYIFDLATGRSKVCLDLNYWDVKELPNGDFINQRRELGAFFPYLEFNSQDTDHIETFRFGLRK